MAKSNLPIEVHDHFSKANLLHGYFVKSLGECKEHALETGKELLAAKSAVPHGSWESECERLFNGSLRNARFYMSFAKDMLALPKGQASAVLLLESTLEGAAKAAKDANRGNTPPKPTPPPPPAPEPETDPFGDIPPDLPDPEEPTAKPTPTPTPTPTGTPPASTGKGKPPKKYDRSFWYKQWNASIGPLCRLVEKIADNVGEKQGARHKGVRDALEAATQHMIDWMGVKR